MTGYTVVNVLGGCLIITSMLVLLSKTPRKGAKLYALQSLVLVGIFLALATTTGSTDLFEWSATAFVTKVLVVPGVLLYAAKKIGASDVEIEAKITPAAAIVLVAVEVFVCFMVIGSVQLPTAVEVKPALAISLAHFFIGITCIVTQRNIFKQIFGYCLMENGSHVTLALLAPQAPGLVETGVATDAFLAVIIMVIVAVRIYRVAHTLDADDLMELKG